MGGVASSYFSGSLIEQYGVSFVFGITALFPLLISASALLVEEEPVKGIQVGSASSDSSPSGDSGNGTGGKGDESVLMALREQVRSCMRACSKRLWMDTSCIYSVFRAGNMYRKFCYIAHCMMCYQAVWLCSIVA